MRKLQPFSGVAFVVLVVIGVVLGSGTPASTDPGSEVAAYYDAHQWRMVVVAFVLAASAFFAVAFASTLARSLAPADRADTGIWDRVLLGGGAMFGVAACLVGALTFALADSPTKVSEPALQALNLLANDCWVFWNAALGVLMLGAAGAWLRSEVPSRWPGRVAVLLGVALFIPFADFVALLASGLWILFTAAVLAAGARSAAYVAATGSAA